jgi:hypothetical protein
MRMTSTLHRVLVAFVVAAGAGVISLQAVAQGREAAAPGGPVGESLAARDFSPAETLLLMTDQLGKLKTPNTLTYAFARRGTLEAAFDDRVTLRVTRKPGSACCNADASFLSGERKVTLPPIDDAQGNPVILYFLEHDIREMKRITKGSTTYFRKRVRMAIYDGARIEPVQFMHAGQQVKGQQIVVAPYRDDPNRARFENMVRKQYVFTLSDAVPGGVAAIRTLVPLATGADPLIGDSLVLEGVVPPPMPAALPPVVPSGASSPR